MHGKGNLSVYKNIFLQFLSRFIYSICYFLTFYDMKKENIIVAAMNQLIAEYSVRAQNARFCHWNVVWPNFQDDHEFYWELYDELSEEVDLFAERVRALEENPISSFTDILKLAKTKEFSRPMNPRQMQKKILEDYESLSKLMGNLAKETEDDCVTQDIIVWSKRQIDKRAWMLRALLGE